MQTTAEIRENFESDGPTTEQLEAVQAAGKRHGEKGWYGDSDFSSDADWCYGIGAEIQRLEQKLDIDDDSVYRLYADAHGEFYRTGVCDEQGEIEPG